MDDSEGEQPASKKRKLSKAAEAKLKAKEKEKAKGKAKANGKGKKGDDDDYEDDSDGEEDAYTALSKMWKDSAKPPVGSFEDCARCKKKFTVVRRFSCVYFCALTCEYRPSTLLLRIRHQASCVTSARKPLAQTRSRSRQRRANASCLETSGLSCTSRNEDFRVLLLSASRYSCAVAQLSSLWLTPASADQSPHRRCRGVGRH